MKKLKVIAGSAGFHTGILALTPSQAKARSASLKPMGGGLYEILSPVQFKHGEEVSFDGQFSKHQLASLEVEDAPSSADLESMDKDELLALALERFGVKIAPQTGAAKIVEKIKALEEEAEAKAAEESAKIARINELEALGDEATEEQKAELEKLLEEMVR